jgi:hypothetical protein
MICGSAEELHCLYQLQGSRNTPILHDTNDSKAAIDTLLPSALQSGSGQK